MVSSAGTPQCHRSLSQSGCPDEGGAADRRTGQCWAYVGLPIYIICMVYVFIHIYVYIYSFVLKWSFIYIYYIVSITSYC